MDYITIPLNALMALCYSWTGSYLLAIVVFTLLTKVILFPISCWMQRESIKMVQLTPDLNALKIKYYGDKDTIAEETQKLYKQKKYHPIASTIPMVIQLVLLMGVIAAVKAMLGGDTTSIYAQIPSQLGGISLLMPVAAGVAAWMLGVGQNKLNPLQKEQSKREQWMTNGLSILISLSLGAFVTVGVCVYWIASNLFSILNQAALNLVIRPAKYIDYDALHESQKELESINAMSAGVSKEDKKREKADYKRFFSVANKHVVFYSEKSGFYKYYKHLIGYLLSHSNLLIHYVTSDPSDQIFEIAKTQSRIRPYYIGEKKLITLFMKMDADVVIMTTPDLNNFYLKRSYVRRDIEYIYIEHFPGSTNLVTSKGAYDHYDTIFCTGPHMKAELREAEAMYDLPAKNLVEHGYDFMDDLLESYKEMGTSQNDPPKILIAPSWQKDNILDSCLEPLIEQLMKVPCTVTVRPHPEYVKRFGATLKTLVERYKERYVGRLFFETDFSSSRSIYASDIVVTDWSGTGMEFSYCTKRPTLFIDTPMKVLNPDYSRYENQPIDITSRNVIGVSVPPDDLDRIPDVIENMLSQKGAWAERIQSFMDNHLYNVGKAGQSGGAYIIQSLIKRKDEKK